jgi:hypothetical protein
MNEEYEAKVMKMELEMNSIIDSIQERFNADIYVIRQMIGLLRELTVYPDDFEEIMIEWEEIKGELKDE